MALQSEWTCRGMDGVMGEALYWWLAIQKAPTGNRTAETMGGGGDGRNSILVASNSERSHGE